MNIKYTYKAILTSNYYYNIIFNDKVEKYYNKINKIDVIYFCLLIEYMNFNKNLNICKIKFNIEDYKKYYPNISKIDLTLDSFNNKLTNNNNKYLNFIKYNDIDYIVYKFYNNLQKAYNILNNLEYNYKLGNHVIPNKMTDNKSIFIPILYNDPYDYIKYMSKLSKDEICIHFYAIMYYYKFTIDNIESKIFCIIDDTNNEEFINICFYEPIFIGCNKNDKGTYFYYSMRITKNNKNIFHIAPARKKYEIKEKIDNIIDDVKYIFKQNNNNIDFSVSTINLQDLINLSNKLNSKNNKNNKNNKNSKNNKDSKNISNTILLKNCDAVNNNKN